MLSNPQPRVLCVEDDEDEARQQPELGVGQVQVRHDEVREARQELPVHEVQHVHQGEQHEQAVAAARQVRITAGLRHGLPPGAPGLSPDHARAD